MTEYKILPEEGINRTEGIDRILKRTAVIAHLYYIGELDYCLSMLQNVPEEIPIIIVTSNTELCGRIPDNGRYELRLKVNIGRDFGAYLVTCGDILRKYEYVLCIHDKKGHSPKKMLSGDIWFKTLWECALSGKNYVLNLLQEFHKDERLGIMAPPVPPEGYMLHYYRNYWTNNLEKAKEILNELGMDSEIADEGADISSIGSVFWVRTSAILPLIERNYQFEDLPGEPFPLDGTICHALERLVGVIVEKLGYKSYTVLPLKYAEYFISCKSDNLNYAVDILNRAGLLRWNDGKIDFPYSLEQLSRKDEYVNIYRAKFARVVEIYNDLSGFCWADLASDDTGIIVYTHTAEQEESIRRELNRFNREILYLNI